MNYYQHHIGDFIRDTARLTDPQCMAYLRILWLYYETESPIHNDVEAIAFKIGANASDVHQILRNFFFLHEGFWHQARCDKEILAFRSKSEKAKNSAEARWNNANAMRTHKKKDANAPLFDANQEPITNNQERDKKPMSAGADRMGDVNHVFGHWQWRMNHKNAKLDDKRKKLIQKALKLGYSTVDLIAAIDGCAKSPFHMGQNDRNAVYDGLDLILRDASKIDGFIKTNSLPEQVGGNHATHQPGNTKPRSRVEVVAGHLFGASAGQTRQGQGEGAGSIQGAATGETSRILEHVPDTGTD